MPVRLALVLAVLVPMTLAFAAAIAALMSAITVSMPEEFALCMGLLPSNTAGCLSAMIVASGARWVYDTHAKIALEVGGGSLI